MLYIKLPEQIWVPSLTKFQSSYLEHDDTKENILLNSIYVHFAKRRNKCEEYHYKLVEVWETIQWTGLCQY